MMRFYSLGKGDIKVCLGRAEFTYGYEYIGVPERLVSTDLTRRAFVVLTEALRTQLGGSPFGPAGTGKTETVKALAQAIGRFCLVFNCDDRFDAHAMVCDTDFSSLILGPYIFRVVSMWSMGLF